MTTTKPTNPYALAYKNFLEQTKDHRLIVLQDSGLYRHLRVQEPGTRMWSWDITTWPGHLATSGDIADGHVFTRETDMLGFFSDAGRSRDGYYSDGAPSIDVRYWAEKLCGGRSQEVKKYDADAFLQQVRESLEQSEELGDEAQAFHKQQHVALKRIYELRGLSQEALDENLATYWAAKGAASRIPSGYRSTWTFAQSVLDDAKRAQVQLWNTDTLTDEQFDELGEELRKNSGYDWYELGDTDLNQHSPKQRRDEIVDDARWHAGSEYEAHEWLRDNEDSVGSDTFEWDLREYDIHFLFTCYAIALTTKLWDEHAAVSGTADTYVLVDGGLVQNNPALPVFDLDVLDSDIQDEASAAEALGLRERILAHPQACTELADVVDRTTAYVQTYGSQDSILILDAALAKEQEARDLRARREAERAARIAKQRADQEARTRG